MIDKKLFRILAAGGVISPGEMLRIIDLARDLGLDGLHFGSRQDIIFPLVKDPQEILARHPLIEMEEIPQSKRSNIMCSYVATDIFPKTAWLTSATYLYVLEQFFFDPSLEINITDPKQRLVPLFTGHLNFIASTEEDYWHLYIQLPGWEEMSPFPALVHTWDLAKVCTAIDPLADRLEDINAVVAQVNNLQQLDLRNTREDLEVPFYPFPYYEGMNRLDDSYYWLGLYWRNNWYNLNFLEAACQLCLEHRIGKLCITPWKSIIITGIPEQLRLDWEKLMGRFGINARHSSLELNWHLPVGDDDALSLKRYLVREFDQRDISTYGLTIGISSSYARPFCSIIIERLRTSEMIDGFAIRPSFNLRYARNFDPNNRQYIEYARNVDRTELTTLLMELSRLYFEQLNQEQHKVITTKTQIRNEPEERVFWQCTDCQSVYDPELGDESQGVLAGTPFEALPSTFVCWTCDAGKESFRETKLQKAL
ncbi:rubredoxin [Neolewinella aurantiaca]|uniref:Rubredoxin n=1 Tax=Neolewinella aurantiaca TaxID=2602767 RepID=A0A5C7FS75_9BACT|nr:rubredoxin [Neolewinella aurantiaca]TXF90888.1 rubredoxin [Neolewinella aurantiaca]